MKVEHPKKVPSLWLFAEKHLPPSLKVSRESTGYGYVFGISIRPRKGWFTESIATIHDNNVEVFHPQYFSDIEKLVQDYEDLGGGEVTIKLWEDFE